MNKSVDTMHWTSTDMLAHKLSNIFADNIVTGHKT